MQSVETQRALADVDRALIDSTIRRLLRQRTRDDLEGMLNAVHPDIVYVVRGSRRVYPFFGRHSGVDEIRRMLIEIAREFENLGSEIHRILVDGNEVAVERTARLRHRGTNVVADVDIVDFLKFDQGLLIEVSEHADTAMIERLINPPTEDVDAAETTAAEPQPRI